jgi:transcriptional regulator with XRE-family HTH domain
MGNADTSQIAALADLKARRRAAGLSRQRVANEAGCSLSHLQMLEGGYSPGRSDVLPRVLTVLDTYDGEGPGP